MDKVMADIKNEEYEMIWNQVKDFMPGSSSILITGANGLIASNIVDVLMYFNEVYKLKNHIFALCRSEEKAEKRFSQYLEDSEFQILSQDICDFHMEQACDYIIHAASNAHPLAYSTKPVETMKTNIIGTMKILEYAWMNGVKKIVYVSTSEVYGENQGDRLVESEYGRVNTLNPRSCYSESKRCAETFCACYCREKKLDISIVRPGYIYGAQITEDNSRADAQFLRDVISGKNIVMKSEGRQRRSYCYVADSVSAIFYTMVYGKCGEAYNIANCDSEASIREYAQTLAEQGGVELQFEIPSDVEKKGYSVVKNSLMSDNKLRKLGWIPQYDLSHGVERMLENVSRTKEVENG